MRFKVKLHFLSQSCLSITLQLPCFKCSASVAYSQRSVKTLTNELQNILPCHAFWYFYALWSRPQKTEDSVLFLCRALLQDENWNGLLHLFITSRVSHSYSAFLAWRPCYSAVNPAGPCVGLPAEVRSHLTSWAFSWGDGPAWSKEDHQVMQNLRFPA